jgi:hypothetical protein
MTAIFFVGKSLVSEEWIASLSLIKIRPIAMVAEP